MKPEDIIRAAMLIAIFTILVIPTASLIFKLPFFGDAALHAYIAKNLGKNEATAGILYPPTYAALSRMWFTFFGEQGLKFNVIIGLALLFFGMYFIVTDITNNTLAGVLAAVLTLGSPKILFYSARMYMEIFLSGIILLTVYFLVRYVNTKSTKQLILLALFTGFTAALKQQGLVLLAPAVFLTILLTAYRKQRQHILIFAAILIAILIIPYGIMYHNSGTSLSVFKYWSATNAVDNFIAKLAGYKEPQIDQIINEKIETVRNQYYTLGGQRAESRHITPLDPFVSRTKFMEVHSAYHDFWQTRTPPFFITTYQIALVIGIFLTIANIFTKNRLLELKAPAWIIVFLIIFLILNYGSFILNNDQTRYHVFISVLMIFFVAQILNLDKTKNKLISLLIIMFVVIISLYSAYADAGLNTRWKNSQLYAPSYGGIESVKTTGEWLANNTKKDENIWTPCSTELVYYTNRRIIDGWELMFFSTDDLHYYLSQNNITYLVLLKTHLSRGEWNHYCYATGEFFNKIKESYPVVYIPPQHDIFVFDVTNETPSVENLNSSLDDAISEFIKYEQT
jgi:hypothetical protein